MIDLSTYRAVLLDVDGTLCKDEHALPGAVELVAALRGRGQLHACLTNAAASPRMLAERLARMGLAIDERHVYPCTSAVADYLLERYPRPRVMNLATDGLAELLEGKVEWVDAPDAECDAVVCAASLNTWCRPERQWAALQMLRRGGVELIGACADRCYPSPRGVEFGAGAVTEMLAYASGVRPTYCGKPQAVFFHELCRRLGVAPSECVLIGDNPESDIGGAKAVGMAAVLTLTGVGRVSDAAAADAVVSDLRELL